MFFNIKNKKTYSSSRKYITKLQFDKCVFILKELYMCGIFGYIGCAQPIETLVNGLKCLEYRGYDSVGLAFIDKEIKIIKSKGNVEKLETLLPSNKKIKVGIAHTRWATHGEANEVNAHPHLSFNGKIAIVHNGIIENYNELKDKYLKGITLKSQTDSEIIAHLLEIFYCEDFVKTIQKVCSKLKGSYALAILDKRNPNKLYITKKSCPLMFGKCKKGYYFSSDINTLSLFCEKYCLLDAEDIVCLEQKKFQIFNNSLKKVKRKNNKFLIHNKEKEKVDCYMEQEISEIPMAIQNTANTILSQFEKIPKNFWLNISKIYLIACGTAYHSCLIGKTYLEKHFFVPIIPEIASEFIYSNPKITNDALCIFVSQSGETADVLLSVKLAKISGAKTLAITNNALSSITLQTDYSLIMNAGWEKAVASTKAYVCQVVSFYLLASLLQNNFENDYKEVLSLSQTIQKSTFEKWINNVLPLMEKYKKIIFIGRQKSFTTALEASLKVKEITYVNSIAVASGELKHGTLALVDDTTLVFSIFCEENLKEKNQSSLKEIIARNGKVIVISPFEDLSCLSEFGLVLPEVNQELLPIISILPFQILACKLSQKLGFDPDMPRNLSKSVTVE